MDLSPHHPPMDLLWTYRHFGNRCVHTARTGQETIFRQMMGMQPFVITTKSQPFVNKAKSLSSDWIGINHLLLWYLSCLRVSYSKFDEECLTTVSGIHQWLLNSLSSWYHLCKIITPTLSLFVEHPLHRNILCINQHTDLYNKCMLVNSDKTPIIFVLANHEFYFIM